VLPTMPWPWQAARARDLAAGHLWVAGLAPEPVLLAWDEVEPVAAPSERWGVLTEPYDTRWGTLAAGTPFRVRYGPVLLDRSVGGEVARGCVLYVPLGQWRLLDAAGVAPPGAPDGR